MIKRWILGFCFICVEPAWSHSTDEEKILRPSSSLEEQQGFEILNLNPEEFFLRTQSVLNHFGVPREAPPNLPELDNLSTLAQAQSRLRYFDLQKTFSKLFSFENGFLVGYQDSQSKKVLDFNVKLKSSSAPLFRPSIFSLNLPLSGLRVAIDPGHIGSPEWDRMTGKYVQDSRGRKVSEGVIALQTSLLLQRELERLGAQVVLTHSKLTPVTDVDYNSFDLRPYALEELRDQVHAPWFINLISKNPAGAKLYKSFEDDSNFKQLFSERSRRDYFIKRADLFARAEIINEFDPHITLIVHYDTISSTDGTGLNPKAPNATKVFIHGNYEATELGSRTQRTYFARGLLDQQRWENSFQLGREIVASMAAELGTPAQKQGSGATVAPGIFSRNLMIPRLMQSGATVYLECFFYNRPQEFEALLITPHPLLIDGKNIPYSNRVAQVVKALRLAVLNYAGR
jgi:N-acetylmuramoyl-L-alanine amidase